MRLTLTRTLPVAALLMTGMIYAAPQQDSNAGPVTFNKQVLPILQKNCQAWSRLT